MTPGSNGTAESYAELLLRFQPRSIKNEEEATVVQRHIDTLIDQEHLSEDEREVLSLLGDLMLAWEDDRFELPPVTPAEAIHALLEAHYMRQSDLVGPVFATKSIASEVLHGKRRLTYEHVRRLARVFHVSPSVFYPSERHSGVA